MLSNSCYEETLLQATSRLLSADLHLRLKKQLAASNQAISPHSHLCAACRNFLRVLKDDDYDIVFRYYFNCCLNIGVLPLYIGKSVSKLQIQVATHVFGVCGFLSDENKSSVSVLDFKLLPCCECCVMNVACNLLGCSPACGV
jgi:hypothetical protein